MIIQVDIGLHRRMNLVRSVVTRMRRRVWRQLDGRRRVSVLPPMREVIFGAVAVACGEGVRDAIADRIWR